MIKEVRLKGWKSILEATLYIDPLTIIKILENLRLFLQMK
jgi:hypothetical protein